MIPLPLHLPRLADAAILLLLPAPEATSKGLKRSDVLEAAAAASEDTTGVCNGKWEEVDSLPPPSPPLDPAKGCLPSKCAPWLKFSVLLLLLLPSEYSLSP